MLSSLFLTLRMDNHGKIIYVNIIVYKYINCLQMKTKKFSCVQNRLRVDLITCSFCMQVNDFVCEKYIIAYLIQNY